VNCDVQLSLIGFPLDNERMVGVGLARLSVLEDAIPFYFIGTRITNYKEGHTRILYDSILKLFRIEGQ
jgi:hypothetical protein